MASDTHIVFYGPWFLAGETVQVSLFGLDCGDYVVGADGTVTVPFAADDGGILTPQYFLANGVYSGDQGAQVTFVVDDETATGTVPALIGKGYTSQGQTLRPTLAQDLGIKTPGLGKVRRSHEFAALFHYAVKINFGTTFENADPIHLTVADGETDFPQSFTYTGAYRGILTDDYGYDSMLCWEIDRPWPAIVCAVSAFIVAEE